MTDEEGLLEKWAQAETERREYAAEFFAEGTSSGRALDTRAIKKFAKLDRRAKAAREAWYAHLKERDR